MLAVRNAVNDYLAFTRFQMKVEPGRPPVIIPVVFRVPEPFWICIFIVHVLPPAAINMCGAKVEQDPLLQLGGSCLCIVPRVSTDFEHRTAGLSIKARYYSLNNEPRTVASSFWLPFALVDPGSDELEAFGNSPATLMQAM